MTLKKRFIAGAVCPQCKQMDTTIIDKNNAQRKCVECNFEEIMGKPTAAEKTIQWVKIDKT